MKQRAGFLAAHGLAKISDSHATFARNLLETLRRRELTQVALEIAVESGLKYRPAVNGERLTGVYRRSIMLVSGRYAVLDDEMGFSLVPWKPVLEPRLGKQLAVTIRNGSASWEIGRHRGAISP